MERKASDGDSVRTASSEEYVNPYAEDHFTPYIPAVEGEEDAPMELSDDESSHGSQGSDSLGPLDGKEGEDGEGPLCGEQALKGTVRGDHRAGGGREWLALARTAFPPLSSVPTSPSSRTHSTYTTHYTTHTTYTSIHTSTH